MDIQYNCELCKKFTEKFILTKVFIYEQTFLKSLSYRFICFNCYEDKKSTYILK